MMKQSNLKSEIEWEAKHSKIVSEADTGRLHHTCNRIRLRILATS